MKKLAVLGSTGSVGSSTLDIVESFPDRFEIVALAAGHRLDVLRPQIEAHRPALVAVAEIDDAKSLAAEYSGIRFVAGMEGLIEVACHPESALVVSALVGSIGLEPTVMAIRAGKDIALANKETLVVAGELVMDEIRRTGVELLPIDSEHNAIHQALQVGPDDSVKRLILTASGGPFRTWTAEEMACATVSETLHHPTWQMGPKISVDSATMMNKGLEIIEAHHLFGLSEDRIGVVIHPQSLIHSFVEYVDGSIIAQMSVNDMRLPILYALSWPERLPNKVPALDLVSASPLTFEQPDSDRFPALGLARQAAQSGGEMPAVLNAANEMAVEAFLEGRCPLTAISATVEEALSHWAGRNRPLTSIEQAITIDAEIREIVGTTWKYAVALAGSENRC